MKLTATRNPPTESGEYRFCFLSETRAEEVQLYVRTPIWRVVNVQKYTDRGSFLNDESFVCHLEMKNVYGEDTSPHFDVRDLAGWWVGPLEFEIPREEA